MQEDVNRKNIKIPCGKNVLTIKVLTYQSRSCSD